LKDKTGNTYTSKSEDLMDFLHGCEHPSSGKTVTEVKSAEDCIREAWEREYPQSPQPWESSLLMIRYKKVWNEAMEEYASQFKQAEQSVGDGSIFDRLDKLTINDHAYLIPSVPYVRYSHAHMLIQHALAQSNTDGSDAVEFAEWLGVNEWIMIDMNVTGGYYKKGPVVKKTSDLYKIFKNK